MTPILADGIDIPFVFGIGIAVLVPLMAFEVFVEAFILRAMWHQKFGDLCRFTFAANILSLLGGIPTKILNAWVYSFLPPARSIWIFCPLSDCGWHLDLQLFSDHGRN